MDPKSATKAELAAKLDEVTQERDQLRDDRDQQRKKANEATKAAREKLDAEARAIDGCAQALDQVPSLRRGIHDDKSKPEPAVIARVLRFLATRYGVEHILASADEIEARERRDQPVVQVDADRVADGVRQAINDAGWWS